MKYINLIDKLSNTDKKVITAYINKFGCKEKDFVGVNEWLSAWSHANQKLYKILGNSFIREFPFSYVKTKDDLTKELQELILSSTLKNDYHIFYNHYIKEQTWLTSNDIKFFNHLMDKENFLYERIDFSLKIKKPGAKKILQIQEGTKPIKAIGRVIDYFKDDFEFHKTALEDFRKKYSIIISEKEIKGTFCLSIHPMDYLTMSDNASNWTSCMSWMDEGCYHVGTIEMMNSNNVICAYLLNDSYSFVFDNKTMDPDTGEIYGVWNNKRWRQLFYITKDIVMSGKAYPYNSNELSKAILTQLKDLASENINWNYQFGPELYQDMIHINNIWHMQNQHAWMKYEKGQKAFKHNIIWDTNGMYNDMLNDSRTSYWCYRNKVSHTKIISASGKANCLCCNESIISYNFDTEDYNERFTNSGNVICEDCLTNKFQCYYCNLRSTKLKLYKYEGKLVCSDCLKKLRICPCCGEPFSVTYGNEIKDICYNNYLYEKLVNDEPLPPIKNRNFTYLIGSDFIQNKEEEFYDKLKYVFKEDEKNQWPDNKRVFLENFYACSPICRQMIEDKITKNAKYIEFPRIWSKEHYHLLIVDPEISEKYRVKNLQKLELESILEPDTKLAT